MKSFAVRFFAATAVSAVFVTPFIHADVVNAYTSPGKSLGYVSDFAGILSSGERAALNNKLGNFERPAGVEVALVTVKSLGGDTIENYAEKLFQEWGIGKKIYDNGLLILIAPNDRQARIEVGYGLEPTVTDVAASLIIRNIMIPAFQAGDYYGGINAAVDKVIGLVEGDPETARFVNKMINESGALDSDSDEQVPIFVPILAAIIFLILISTRGGRRILWFMVISGMFRGGRGGDGFGGGGFGGFGGGRSGGGGASGRW